MLAAAASTAAFSYDLASTPPHPPRNRSARAVNSCCNVPSRYRTCSWCMTSRWPATSSSSSSGPFEFCFMDGHRRPSCSHPRSYS